MTVQSVLLTIPSIFLHITSYSLCGGQGEASVRSSSIFDSIPKNLIDVGIGAIAALMGVIISIFGNWIVGNNLAKRQAFVEIRKNLFNRRLDIYLKLTEMLWQGYSVIVVTDNNGKRNIFPKAYNNLEELKKWLNSLVELFDRNRLLLDQKTYTAFDNGLNQKLLNDIETIKEKGPSEKECRKIGEETKEEMQRFVEEIFDSSRKFIKSKYKVDLEKVL